MEDKEQKQAAAIVIKHYCRVCNRGFGCAGALGGHMRTHGDNHNNTRFQPNLEEKCMSDIVTRSKSEGSIKHSYFLRTNTNRILSHRFAADDSDGENNLVGRNHRDEPGKYACSEDDMRMMKFKKPDFEELTCSASREEQDLANCLVMLSNKTFINNNKEEKHNNNNNNNKVVGEKEEFLDHQHEKGMFQCKACKKFFSSHQALGGHRASHKKVKGCYAAKFSNLNDDENSIEDDLIHNQDEILPGSSYSSETRFDHLDSSSDHQIRQNRITKSKSKDHQCSICQRVFTSGQALGGHKRCHWLTSNNLPDTTLLQNLRDQFRFDSPSSADIFKKPMLETEQSSAFDLNFPPLVDHTKNSLSSNYETPERLFLQLWGNGCNNEQMQQHGKRVHESLLGSSSSSSPPNTVEKECRMKKVKLNELKDMNLDGGGSSSRWLQMGFASTTDT